VCDSIGALELHHLLSERGFRGSSRDDHTIIQGNNMRKRPAPTQSSTVPRQLSTVLDSVRLRNMSPSELAEEGRLLAVVKSEAPSGVPPLRSGLAGCFRGALYFLCPGRFCVLLAADVGNGENARERTHSSKPGDPEPSALH
jgi:hypothetical protein